MAAPATSAVATSHLPKPAFVTADAAVLEDAVTPTMLSAANALARLEEDAVYERPASSSDRSSSLSGSTYRRGGSFMSRLRRAARATAHARDPENQHGHDAVAKRRCLAGSRARSQSRPC